MTKKSVRALGLLSAILLAGCGATGHASKSKHGSQAQNAASMKKGTGSHKTGGVGAKKGGSPKKTASSRGAMTGASTARAGKLSVLGFWSHHKSAPVSSLSASNHTLTAISPFWYSVTASGALTSKVDPSLLAEAKKLHIAITPLVNDGTGTQAFLTSKATRTLAVQNIDHMLASMHFQGVNIDFEPPHTSRKSELTAFMVQLRDTLPKTDTITMDIVPHSGGAYDYAKLAPEVNQLVLMSYDEHSDGTPAGPVAALNWVQSIVGRLKGVVPSSKIDLGVALYGYEWAPGSTHATTIPYNTISSTLKSKGTWNSRYQEMTAAVGGNIYWWENRKGIAEKIALAKKDHLAGIALWQVGFANSAIYTELRKDI